MKKLFTLFQKKKKLLFVAIFLLPITSVSTSWAQTAIFNPSMSITPYGSVNSNGSEGYANSIDNNVNTKFLDNYPGDGIGFTVDLGGVSKIASSISVTTANDKPGRDPKNYEVLGSNDGSNFTSIATGIIQCISTRYFTRFYCFENSTAYKYYRVNFTNTCSEYIFQFAEVQLYTPGPGIGGSVSANQSISGLIATTPSGEANLNSGSSVQIMAGYYTFEPEFSFTPGQTAAQSFKTSSNVILNAIKINVAEVITAGSYTLTIFQGEGTSGSQLLNQVVSITNSGTNTFALDATLALIGEQSYTFKLETRDGNAKFNWTNSSGSDYSSGSGYTNGNNNNTDFNFQLVYQNNVNWQSITLTGFFGGIQKWQKATDSIFSTPIDIASISATLEPYLVGDILQTTYFRAVVGCSSVYSDYVTIAVNSTNYTVTFDANEGIGSMANQTIASGVSANLTTNAFTRTGYTFAGWATTSIGTVAYANSASYTMGATDVTLYAQWEENPQPLEPTKVNCWDTFVFNTGTNAWDNIGTQATEPTKVNCWDNFVFNTGTCAWDNTGTQATEPAKVNCWDTFVFNLGTCAWDNNGTQDSEPTKLNCWDNFVFNTGTCAWDNTGTQDSEPTKVNCWDTFVFNTGTCSWDNTGTQATEPNKVNCWDTFVFNTGTCAWNNTGTQATEPTKVNCWDTFVFNTGTCAWDNTGTQATEPTKVNCWDTFVFNTGTCAWDNTGTQDSEPTKVNCWDTFVFNTGTCSWDNTGTQATEPNKVNCWDTFVFNTGTCAWNNTGSQATEPTKVNCWDTFVFNTETCAWDNTGTQDSEPTKVNCWDTFVFNTGTCAWDNAGTQATEPTKVNSWETFVFNTTSCAWDNTGTPTNSTKIQSSQCGITLATLSTVIVPIAVPLAQGYKYKVTNTATNEVNYYTRSKTATFALSQSADTGSGSVAIKLSSTYAIAVAVKINGVFSAYGEACLVNTPLLPTTKIQDALCGKTLANINSYLYLKAGVSRNNGYRYKVTQGAEVRTYDRPSGSYNPFQLKQLAGGATYATNYDVAVSVFYNGAWQPYGATCTVTTPAPLSKLASTQCGITLNKTNTSVLTANYVGVAQAYRFEVSKGASTYTVETASGSLRTFKMTEVPGLTLESGATYGIRVAIKANGTWQPYGTSCNVTTYGSPAPVKMAATVAKPETVFSALAYPNPFSSAFQLELNTSSKATVDLKVYDVLGRLIENRQWNAAEASEQEMGNNYPSGVYNIILNQGENVKTLRVIKR